MKRRLLEKLKKQGRNSPREPLSNKPEPASPHEQRKQDLPAQPVTGTYVPPTVSIMYLLLKDMGYAAPSHTRDAPSGPTAEDIRWAIGQELLRLFVKGRDPATEGNIASLATRIYTGRSDYSGTVSAYPIHFDGTRDRRFDIQRAQPWVHSRPNN